MAIFNKKGKYLTAEMRFRYNPKTELIEVTTKDGELGKDGFLFTISPTSLPGRKVLETLAQYTDIKSLVKPVFPPLPEFPLSYTDETIHSNPDRIPLGVNKKHNAVYWEPGEHPHLLITGKTGSGKTVAQNVIRHHLSQHQDSWELYFIDSRGVISRSGRKVARLSDLVEETIDLLQDKLTLIQSRFKEMNEKNILHFSEMPREENPRIMIMIDEIAPLTRIQPEDSELEKDNKLYLLKNLESIGLTGRSAGVHLCLSTQLPDRTTMSSSLRNQCSIYATGQLNAMMSNQLFWNDKASKIDPWQKGLGYFSFQGMDADEGYIQGFWNDNYLTK